MSDQPNERLERLKRSLAELRSNRHHFSDESFAQITMLLLQALRKSQTDALPEDGQLDEIRLVTVMFVDVKDSTEMIQRLDTSDWKNIIAQAHARIAALVSQWGGQIGQYLGDGVMCFFGARHSQGADATNAVSCGLAIQQSIAEYSRLVAQQYEQIEFSMRLGISTGKLVVGLMGEDQKREFLALGPATNRAARLQGIAEPGQVFIDEATYARVRHNFVMLPQAPAHLKGFEEAIKVYQVVGRRSRPSQEFTSTDIRGIYVPLMGREKPLTLIDDLIDQSTKSHKGHVITLMGDIGVGKSRLLHAINQRIAQQFRVFRLSTTYEARLRRYNLLVESLGSYGYDATEAQKPETKQILIARAQSILDNPISAAAAKTMVKLADGSIGKDDNSPAEHTLQWLAAVADQQPLLLLVDNLQWADDDSVQFLESLAQALENKPALIVAAARLDFLTAHPDFLQDTAQHTRIMLDPLLEDETRLLLDAVLQHVKGVPAALVDVLLQRSEGNPLFIHEYLTMLFDQNLVEQEEDGGWRFNIRRYNDALNALPHGLISMLQARLDELEPEARLVLQVAAVMGNVFWQNAVQDLMRLPSVDNWLSLLTTQGIITADTENQLNNQIQYRFRYKLYHDVAYEMIPRGQRLRYHQQFAEWLLLHANGQTSAYPLLAEQFAQGEQYAAALYTYQEAVEDRLQQEEPQHALALIDQGLGLASHLPRSEALPIVSKLWMYRGRALCMLQRYNEASAAAQSALMLTREIPDDQFMEVRATAEMILSSAHTATGRYTDAQQALKRADTLLPTEATALQSILSLRRGALAEEQGEVEAAEVHYYRGLLQAESAENARYITMAQQYQGALALEQGQFAEALSIFQMLLSAAEQSSSQPALQYAKAHLAQIYLSLELPRQALETLEDFTFTPEATHGRTQVQILLIRALAYLQSDAVVEQKEGKKLLAKLAEHSVEHISLQQEMQIAQAQGLLYTAAYEEAHMLINPLVQSSMQRNPRLQGRRLRLLGEALFRLGKPDAVRYFQEALEAETQYGGRDLWRCHTWLARVVEDADLRTAHHEQAAKILRAIADSLRKHPQIHAAFLSAAAVRAAMHSTLQTE